MNEDPPSRWQRMLRGLKRHKILSAAAVLGLVMGILLLSPALQLSVQSPPEARFDIGTQSIPQPALTPSAGSMSTDGASSSSPEASTASASTVTRTETEVSEISPSAGSAGSGTGPLMGSVSSSPPKMSTTTSTGWSDHETGVETDKAVTGKNPLPPRGSPVPASQPIIVIQADAQVPKSTASAAHVPEPAPPPAPLFPLDAYLAQLTPGNMAFRRPPSMLRGETKTVTLVVSQTLSLPELKQQIQAKGDVVEGHAIKIAPMMQAHLTGNAFEINLITQEAQPISQTETTEWKWEIKPKEFGKLRLHLAVSALVKLGDAERIRTLRTFEETVDVNVSWTESAAAFLGEHVEWIMDGLGALVLIPLFGWLVKRWRHYLKKRRGIAVAHRPAQPTGSSANPFARFRGKFRRTL